MRQYTAIPVTRPTTKQKPQVLLDDFNLTLIDLYQLKGYSYTSFLGHLVNRINDRFEDPESHYSKSYWNKIEYPGTSINIEIPDFANPDVSDLIYTFRNPKGFTKGQLLYEIVKVLPKDVEDYDQVYWEGLVKEGDHFYLRLGS